MKPKVLRVLVVDDHSLVRDGLRFEIQANFPTALIAEAGSAPEALASFSAQHSDLVLLDINLPGENGIELARRLLAADKSVRILVIAGEADPWTVNEAIKAGASGFMTKTLPAGYLGRAMKSVLAGRIVLCPDAEAALQHAETETGTAAEPPGPSILSQRQQEVLRHIAHGDNTKSIASHLDISPKTVETHRQHIMRKLGLQSVASLTRYAIRHRLTAT